MGAYVFTIEDEVLERLFVHHLVSRVPMVAGCYQLVLSSTTACFLNS